jgi:hypothetical protein
MPQFLKQLGDAVPHPVAWGCVAIGIGFVLAGLASPIKAKADKKRNSRNIEAQSKGRWLQRLFVTLLVSGGILTGFGTWLTVEGGETNAQRLLDQTRKENDEARRESKAKLEMVLNALNAAKQEQTRLLTDEKIKGLQKDIVAWLDDFAARKSDKQRQLEEARLANVQRESQISADAAPVFSFVLRIVEESLRAYVKRTGADIEIMLRPLPQNYYENGVNNPARVIRFSSAGQWQFELIANLPANETQAPRLDIRCIGKDRREGVLMITPSRPTKKLFVQGWGILPTPDTSAIFGEYELEGYEETLGRVLQRLIEAQLAQMP